MQKSSRNLADLSPSERALLVRRLQERAGKEAQGITRRAQADEYPLSFAQQRLWFLDQLHQDRTLYNISMPIEIRSSLEPGLLHWALQACLSTILARHEVLRATIVVQDGVPIQHVRAAEPMALPQDDLSMLSAGERAVAVRQVIGEEARRPFDLGQDLMLRARLVWLGEDAYVLVLTAHHIAFDAWSVGVLLAEMRALLTGCDTGRLSELPELPIQYADFAVWQRQWLHGAVLERQLAYWKGHLQGAPPVIELPISHARPAVRSANGARRAFVIPAGVAAALNALSRGEGATLFMTLFAAWNVLLGRYSGQDDLVVGSPIANRNRREVEGLIGFFVNSLPLRTSLAGNPSFRALLGRVRAVALDAYAHQDVPFEMLVEVLHPDRSLSYSPLFQVVFVLQTSALSIETVPGTRIRLLTDMDGPAQFDLTMSMMEMGDELQGVLEFNTDLFQAASIERMIGHFAHVLAGVAADPDQPIALVPLLTDAEREEMVGAWNRTEVAYPLEQPAHALFEAHVVRAPDAPAVVFDGSPLSYAQVNARANQVAHFLRACGVGPEQVVGVCVERSPEMVVGLLGVLKAGAAFLPIDPLYPQDRLTYMLEDAQVPLLLTQQRLIAQLPAHRARVVCLDVDWPTIAMQPATNPPPGASADSLVYMIYTSGSTGRPKGTLLVHRGLCNFILDYARMLEVGPGSRVLQFFSFGFDGSVAEIFLTMLSGATLCMTPADVSLTGTQLLRVLAEYAITAQILPPAVLAVLSPGELPALRTIAAAGERCTGAIVSRWGRGRRFFNVYGATEATIASTMFLADGDWADEATIPVGHPMANTQLYVLDGYFQPVPVGVIGEIYIGGVGVGRGYLNRPDLTSERFVEDPFCGGGGRRLYKTGDLGRFRADGALEFCDRADDQVKVRGYRIEPGEIEAALRQYPEMREAVVVAASDGVGSRRLVAYVLFERADSGFSLEHLRSFVQTRLPEHMVPSLFVVLDALPLTPNGKVDRRMLAARPITQQALSDVSFVAPQSALEQQLAVIWGQVLGVESIGVDDNFFDLGGSSLSMVKIQDQLRPLVAQELSIVTLFRHPTIRALAAYLTDGEAMKVAAPSEEPRERAQKHKETLQRQRRRVR